MQCVYIYIYIYIQYIYIYIYILLGHPGGAHCVTIAPPFDDDIFPLNSTCFQKSVSGPRNVARRAAGSCTNCIIISSMNNIIISFYIIIV